MSPSKSVPSKSLPSHVTRLALPIVAMCAAVALGAVYSVNAQDAKPKTNAKPPEAKWSAAAPGRVEPQSGIIHLNPAMLGNVTKVLVRVGDKVVKGQPLVRLEDEDLLARVRAAEADVEARKKNRSTSGSTKIKQRRDAEDDLETAENDLREARRVLDELTEQWFDGSKNLQEIAAASKRVTETEARLRDARNILRSVRDDRDAASPSTGELALTSARSQRGLALAGWNKTVIRAPKDGTVLDVNVKTGETVGPQGREPLILLGDLTGLRVKAEIDARDVAEVRTGQDVLIRADAFDGKDFKGKVVSIGQVLKPARLGGLGTQRPANARVLEATIEVEGKTPLISGMEVDVLFLSDSKSADASTTQKAKNKAKPKTTTN